MDGISNGVYFCRSWYAQLADNAIDQRFAIRFEECSGAVRWAFWLNGVKRTCAAFYGGDGTPFAGSESVYTTATQDLRIRYSYLWFSSGGHWFNWGSNNFHCNDVGYLVYEVSPPEFYVRLA